MNFIFFFQAEDGIRDYKVTGVQTCALPILLLRQFTETINHIHQQTTAAEKILADYARLIQHLEIGRASCRERV